MQRARLLTGAVGAIEQYGYAGATVAHITTRARVSRRTFYELFDNRDACLAALIEDVVVSIEDEIAAANLNALPWRERVRGGLVVLLAFFDREPVLARVCVVQALHGGAGVLDSREAILARLLGVLDQGRDAGPRAAQCTALTAEGLVGATLTIVHARLLRGDRQPLSGLLGELMSLIVLPYLGPAAARREQSRPVAPPPVLRASHGRLPAAARRDPLADIPMRLTYRTARVLECVAERPGISNRAVADLAGVTDQGQISKLLARLERLGLAENRGEGHAKGEPNAWHLTPLGGQVTVRLNSHARNRRAAA
jgi:AcrR family transcriptional regulator/DNA-binding MarR family transcriptional regulator